MSMAQHGSGAIADEHARSRLDIRLRNGVMDQMKRGLDFITVFRRLIGIDYAKLKQRLRPIVGTAFRSALDHNVLAQIGIEFGSGNSRAYQGRDPRSFPGCHTTLPAGQHALPA